MQEDEYDSGSEDYKGVHKLYKRKQRELEKADWEEKEDEYTL